MKKMLTILLAATLIMSMAITSVPAKGSQTSNPSNGQQGTQNTTQSGTQSGAQQGQMNQYQYNFEENKFEAEQLRTQTRAQLDTQIEMTCEYKAQLRIMNETYNNMSEQERAANSANIDNLMKQIREAHRYILQIRSVTQGQARNLNTCINQNGLPTEEEAEEAIEVIDEI